MNADLSFVRLKPVEQLSPTLSPSDCETKFERKKSLPSHVGTQSDLTIFTKLCTTFIRFCSFLTTKHVYSVLFSYQRQMPSIISYSRRSAKMSYSNKVSFRFSFHMNARSKEMLDLNVRDCVCQQVTLVPCRETCYTRAKCSSPITGSVSTPKSLAEISRYDPETVIKTWFEFSASSCVTADFPGITWWCFLISRFQSPWCLWRLSKKLKLHYWCQTPLWLKLQAIRWEDCCDNQFFPLSHKHERDFSDLIVFQHVFVSFLSRNTTYKLLRSICVHLEVNNVLYKTLFCPNRIQWFRQNIFIIVWASGENESRVETIVWLVNQHKINQRLFW